MGSKRETKSESKSHAVTTPNTPEYIKTLMQGFAGGVSDYMGRDPYSMVAGPSQLQQMAFRGGLGLGGPGGWRGTAGQRPPAPMPQNPLALTVAPGTDPTMPGQQAPLAAPGAPVAQAPAVMPDPNQQYIDQLQAEVAKQYGKLNINPYV